MKVVSSVYLLFLPSSPPLSSQFERCRGVERQKLDNGAHRRLGCEYSIALGAYIKSVNAQRQSRASPVTYTLRKLHLHI